MKTPEQMATEFLLKSDCAHSGFLAGYQAAKDEDQAKMQNLEANWKFCCEDKARLLNELAAAERAKDQLADGGKVMCNTTMEEIKAVDTGELMPITNSPRPAKWISVKERLPERSQKVLALGKDQTVLLLKLRADHDKDLFGNWEYLSGFDRDINGYLVIDVTHWMPLPEAPRETE